MEEKEPTIKDIFQAISQIGIIVPDLEKTKEAMQEVFGLMPDKEGHMKYEEVEYRGKKQPAEMKVAFYDKFNVQLEIIEPTGKEDTVWSDALRMGLGGLHHIRWDVEDNDRAVEMMAEKGIDVWMQGRSAVNPDIKFTYYDSVEKLGFIVESMSKPS